MQRLTRAVGVMVVTTLVAGGVTWGSSAVLQAAAASPEHAEPAGLGLPTITLPTLTLPTVTLPSVPLPTLPLPTESLPTSPPTSLPTSLPTSPPTSASPSSSPGGDVLALLGGLGLPASAEVGQLIALTDPVWSLPGVTTSYQWLRDGAPIPGADGQTYVPTIDDAGHALSAQVTGALAGIPLLTVVTDSLDIPQPAASAVSPVSDAVIGGTRKIGTSLTVSGPTWDPADAQTSYQWLRDGGPIAGATTSTYLLAAEDFGHSISVTATGHKDGFTDNTITSDPVDPVIGDALQFVMKPHITGTGKVGRLLTVDPGQWSGGTEGSGQPAYSFQWLRDGAAISGAVAQTYQVDPADAGKDLTVLVTATRPAYRAGRFTTAPVHVAKLASTLSASLPQKSVKQGKPARMKLVLKVPGAVSPTGAVQVFDGKKLLKRTAFAKGRHGTVVVQLGRLKAGVHKLKAVYAGTATVAGTTSKVVRLTVTKSKKTRR